MLPSATLIGKLFSEFIAMSYLPRFFLMYLFNRVEKTFSVLNYLQEIIENQPVCGISSFLYWGDEEVVLCAKHMAEND